MWNIYFTKLHFLLSIKIHAKPLFINCSCPQSLPPPTIQYSRVIMQYYIHSIKLTVASWIQLLHTTVAAGSRNKLLLEINSYWWQTVDGSNFLCCIHTLLVIASLTIHEHREMVEACFSFCFIWRLSYPVLFQPSLIRKWTLIITFEYVKAGKTSAALVSAAAFRRFF